MKPLALLHVAFSNKSCVEGFITDDPRDANWTATGKPKSNCVPSIGEAIRDRLDNSRAKLPRKWALVFDSEEDAVSAHKFLSEFSPLKEGKKQFIQGSIESKEGSQ